MVAEEIVEAASGVVADRDGLGAEAVEGLHGSPNAQRLLPQSFEVGGGRDALTVDIVAIGRGDATLDHLGEPALGVPAVAATAVTQQVAGGIVGRALPANAARLMRPGARGVSVRAVAVADTGLRREVAQLIVAVGLIEATAREQ